MKKYSFLIPMFVAFTLLLSTCKKPDLSGTLAAIKSTPITIGYNSPPQIQVIPVSSTIGQFMLKQDSIYINIDSITTNNNVKRSQLKSIVLKTITFSIGGGSSNFDFIKYVNGKSTIGGATQNYLSPNPLGLGLTSFTIDGGNFDILPAIDQKYFNFSFSGETVKPISQNVLLNIVFQFDINVTPL